MSAPSTTPNEKPATRGARDGLLCLLDDDTLEIFNAYHNDAPGGKPA